MRSMLAVLAYVLMVPGCGTPPTAPSEMIPPTGELRIAMSGTPFRSAKAALFTYSYARVYRDTTTNLQTFEITKPGGTVTRTCDLNRLPTTVPVAFAMGTVPGGSYTEIRFALTAVTLYFENGSDGPVCAETITPPEGRSMSMPVSKIPSVIGPEDGIEVRMEHRFEVTAFRTTSLTLHFDGDRSFVAVEGGYRMSPVVSPIDAQ